MIVDIKPTKFSTAQTLKIKRNFRKNLEMGKNQDTIKKQSFPTDKKHFVHIGNIYQCVKSYRQ